MSRKVTILSKKLPFWAIFSKGVFRPIFDIHKALLVVSSKQNAKIPQHKDFRYHFEQDFQDFGLILPLDTKSTKISISHFSIFFSNFYTRRIKGQPLEKVKFRIFIFLVIFIFPFYFHRNDKNFKFSSENHFFLRI